MRWPEWLRGSDDDGVGLRHPKEVLALLEDTSRVRSALADASIVAAEALFHGAAAGDGGRDEFRPDIQNLFLAGAGVALAATTVILVLNEANTCAHASWVKLNQPTLADAAFGKGIEAALAQRHRRHEKRVYAVTLRRLDDDARESDEPSPTPGTGMPAMADVHTS